MVSLSRSFDTSPGGGVFFNDNSLTDDDRRRLQPVTGRDDFGQFKPLDTIVFSAFHISCAVGLLLVAIVLAAVWESNDRKCAPYFIVLYLHAVFWCMSWIIHHQLERKHETLRINGYLEFYKETDHHIKIPFYVVSSWSTILLVVDSILHQLYPNLEQRCGSHMVLSPINILSFLLGLETVVLSLFIGNYIKKVLNFNQKKQLPDVLNNDWEHSSPTHSAGEVGYREHGDHEQDLLERQADIIQHLREHNARLSHKIMALSSQVRGDHV